MNNEFHNNNMYCGKNHYGRKPRAIAARRAFPWAQIVAVASAFLFLAALLGASLAHAAGQAALQGEQKKDAEAAGGAASLRTETSFDMGFVRGAADGVRLSDPKAISAFYDARGGVPLWTGAGGLNQKALDLISALDQAWTHGLNPAQYHLSEIEAILNAPSAENRNRLEMLLTDALVRYGRDVTGTRAGISRGAYDISRKPLETKEILDIAAHAPSLDKALHALEPRGGLYQALRKELIALMADKKGGQEDAALDFGGHALYPGDSHKNVSLLRARLGVSGHTGNQDYYDDALAQAVQAFQRAHRLDADGVIGPNTLRVLNRDREGKIRQILANLERLRWLDQERPDRYIIVNIPSQTLWLVKDRAVVDEMKVIVGKPIRGTKDFKAMVTGVRFNPTWTVPPTIKRKDFLPKLINNPDYLKEKGISLLQKQGGRMVRVDSSSVDWSSVTGSDLAQMSMVQNAGERNALGKVRILMPNPYDMYLHDTSSPELFEEEERTLSSGCVRIEKPEAVADFVLSSNESWNREKMDKLLAAGRTVDIPAEHKLPVYVIYQTIWLDSSGRLVYGDDVYGRDEALLRTLDKANNLPYFKEGT